MSVGLIGVRAGFNFSLPAPVVTPINFTITDPTTNDELIGTISATSAPTSWAIASGNSSGYFAIYIEAAGTAHLRTAATGTIPPDGIYDLTVTASNAAGVSSPAAVVVTVQAAASQVPVVTAASFTIIDPTSNSELIGTLSATNSPTSWAITAGNSSGYFTLDNSGNLSVEASGAVPPDGSYSLTVTATNGSGTSSPATISITVQAAQAGTYDNTANWPSANNRPTYNSTTNTLSWTGPSGGGASTTTDVAQTQVLTSHSGLFTTSSNGQIIENMHFSVTAKGAINIQVNHSNVTIRKCYIQGAGGSNMAQVNCDPSITGLIVEDCFFDGKGSDADEGTFNILGDPLVNCIVRRNNMTGAEQMISRTQRGNTYHDNWFHDVFGADQDMIEIYEDDGTGLGSNNVDIQNNTFQQETDLINSAINMSNWTAGNISSINIQNNRFMGLASCPHVICDDNTQGGGTINFSCWNNGWDSAIVNYSNNKNNGVSPDSGNYILSSTADNAPRTGTLINGGTGSLPNA